MLEALELYISYVYDVACCTLTLDRNVRAMGARPAFVCPVGMLFDVRLACRHWSGSLCLPVPSQRPHGVLPVPEQEPQASL